MEHYLIRLLPTRPTFPGDITEDERRVMGAHAAVWMDLIERGVCLVYGPVMDPRVTWGLAIVEVADRADAEKLAAADPAVKAGIGTMEIAPMRLAGERKRGRAA